MQIHQTTGIWQHPREKNQARHQLDKEYCLEWSPVVCYCFLLFEIHSTSEDLHTNSLLNVECAIYHMWTWETRINNTCARFRSEWHNANKETIQSRKGKSMHVVYYSRLLQIGIFCTGYSSLNPENTTMGSLRIKRTFVLNAIDAVFKEMLWESQKRADIVSLCTPAQHHLLTCDVIF